jgi:hypothetical protein
MRAPYLPNYQKLLYPFIISFYIFILLMVSSINEFIIYIYYFILANQLANIKKNWNNSFKKRNNIRKLLNIPRELPKHINRATYSEEMLEVLSKKHYTDFPLLPNELDAWRLETDMIGMLIKLYRFGNYISEKKRRFSERKILNLFPSRGLREASVQSPLL